MNKRVDLIKSISEGIRSMKDDFDQADLYTHEFKMTRVFPENEVSEAYGCTNIIEAQDKIAAYWK